MLASLLLLSALAPQESESWLTLPDYFASGMVLQCEHRIRVWGKGKPGNRVHVEIDCDSQGNAAEARTAEVGIDGQWQVELPAREPSYRTHTLRVRSGKEQLRLHDILIGEVWFAAGQSNMEWPMSRTAGWFSTLRTLQTHASYAELASSIRFYQASYTATGASGQFDQETLAGLAPERFRSGSWHATSVDSLGEMSGVAWHFANYLHAYLGRPIGIIEVAAGGTPTESWIASDALLSDPKTQEVMQTTNWLEHEALGAWCRQRAQQNLSLAIEEGWSIPGDSTGPFHAFQPGFMWRTAVEPFVRVPIRGVIWYQGESNANSLERVAQHEALFQLLVRSWRQAWGRSKLPFHFVQLPSLNREHWPEFREQQRRLARDLEGVSMAVSIDVGNPKDVHPRAKRPVGHRLAREAMADSYSWHRLEFEPGPTLRIARPVIDGVELLFYDLGKGLDRFDPQHGTSLEWQDREGNWHPVTEIRHRDRQAKPQRRFEFGLVAILPEEKAVAVRYAWAPVPMLTLFDAKGLPVGPFVTEIVRD